MFYNLTTFLICMGLSLQSAFATPAKGTFSVHHLRAYSSLKDTHDLAKAALPLQAHNRNLPFLIKTLLSAAPQNLPTLQRVGGKLIFKAKDKTYTLIPLGGSRFSLDGQRIDLNEDLSHMFSRRSPWPIWIQESHAVAPLFWMAVIIITAVVGSSVCFNSTVTNYLNKDELRAKWLRPGEFNRIMRKLKEELKPICPGAAWADTPSGYDYELFFQNYCARTSDKSIPHSFDSVTAGLFYGPADEADQALIQAATQDAEFMRDCFSQLRREQNLDDPSAPAPSRR